MKLVATRRAPDDKADRLRYLRADGTSCESTLPRQGILPHDLIHWVVETRLGLDHGFLGLVARGADATFAMGRTHDPRNRDIEREAVQAEALVEALQTQLWNGHFDRDAFLCGVEMAVHARGFEPPDLGDRPLEHLLYIAALDLHHRWSQLPVHGSIELPFPNAAT
jgi:hypothetical protein